MNTGKVAQTHAPHCNSRPQQMKLMLKQSVWKQAYPLFLCQERTETPLNHRQVRLALSLEGEAAKASVSSFSVSRISIFHNILRGYIVLV